MQELGIEHLADKSYTRISGGERQLVLIALPCQEPEIILFDEPTSHLDFRNRAMVLRTIKNYPESMTIVLTTHFPNHVWKVGTSGHAGVRRMVAQRAVDKVMTEENLSEAYGVAVKIYNAESNGESVRFCEPNL